MTSKRKSAGKAGGTAPARPVFETLLGFAHELADKSRKATLAHFRTSLAVDNKASGAAFDPVTAADKAAERIISDLVRERYPDHGFLGEEHGTHNEKARLQWVIDPIDGTRAFIMGTPMWGTLIGLVEDGRPVLGIMDQPYMRERFWSGEVHAHLGTGDGKIVNLATRDCARIEDAVFSTTSPEMFSVGAELEAFQRLRSRARMTRYGGDCYAYAMLAAGFVDLVVESGLKPFDVIALIPIVERAGGRMTTWDGKPATSGDRIIAAGDPRVHEAAMRVLAG
jgi:myo-inositol-1(or 4)-monophosphatase